MKHDERMNPRRAHNVPARDPRHMRPLVESHTSALENKALIKEYARRVLERQQVSATDETLDRLINLLGILNVIPAPDQVMEKSSRIGMPLTEDEVHVMGWIIQGFQEMINDSIGGGLNSQKNTI